MAHYAEIDENNIVIRVIVIDQDVLESGVMGDPNNWIQTSYNTYAGVHRLAGTPLRKNYAGVGYVYDKERDAFISPSPFNNYILNESTCQWEPPIEMPNDGNLYIWDDDNINWLMIPSPPDMESGYTFDRQTNTWILL